MSLPEHSTRNLSAEVPLSEEEMPRISGTRMAPVVSVVILSILPETAEVCGPMVLLLVVSKVSEHLAEEEALKSVEASLEVETALLVVAMVLLLWHPC